MPGQVASVAVRRVPRLTSDCEHPSLRCGLPHTAGRRRRQLAFLAPAQTFTSVVPEHSGPASVSSPLTAGKCFFCKQGYTSRCNGGGQLLGTAANPGAQAEYVRIAEAEASLSIAPDDVKEELLLLLADILPTGYSAAYNARHMLDDHQVQPPQDFVQGRVVQPQGKKGVAVVVGCGPVSITNWVALRGWELSSLQSG